MNRRGRAVAFASAAAVCAGLAASATGGAGNSLEAQLGELRPALVVADALPARRRVSARVLDESVEVRRVPERFLPADTLAAPSQLLGRRPVTGIPAGSYVLTSQLRTPGPPAGGAGALDPGTRPVEIAVSGAGALAASPRSGRRVDVVVTSESGPAGGAGRTYVAASRVELLELAPAGEGGAADALSGPALDSWTATLALSQAQALRLIHAESFARSVRLITS